MHALVMTCKVAETTKLEKFCWTDDMLMVVAYPGIAAHEMLNLAVLLPIAVAAAAAAGAAELQEERKMVL